MTLANKKDKQTNVFRPNIDETTPFVSEQLTLDLDFSNYRFPDRTLILLDSISRELTSQEDLSNISYAPNRKKPNEIITGTLFFTEEVEEALRSKVPELTNKAMLILSGVMALWHQGERYVTPKQIYRMATSQTNARVTEKQEQETKEIINALSCMRIEVDVTAEYHGIKGLKMPQGKRVTIQGNLLSTKAVTIYQEARGNQNAYSYTVYNITDEPFLYSYAVNMLRNAFTEISTEQLGLGSGFEDAMLTRYLGRRIALMGNKNNNVKNVSISLETIYKQIDLKNPTRKQKARIKDKIEQILNAWKVKGEIKNYTFERIGTSKYPNTSKDTRPYKSVLIGLNDDSNANKKSNKKKP